MDIITAQKRKPWENITPFSLMACINADPVFSGCPTTPTDAFSPHLSHTHAFITHCYMAFMNLKLLKNK